MRVANEPVFIMHTNLRFDDIQLVYHLTDQRIESGLFRAMYYDLTDNVSGDHLDLQPIDVDHNMTNSLINATKNNRGKAMYWFWHCLVHSC